MDMKAELNGRFDQMYEALKEVTRKATDTETKVNILTDDIADMKKTMTMVCAELQRSQISAARLRREIVEIKIHSMKQNIIFDFAKNGQHGKETHGENCENVVKKFMADVMKIPNAARFYIPVAHRMGGNQSPRPILVKIPNASELNLVFKHAGKYLKGTNHKVYRQTPPAVSERKNFALPLFKEKRQNPDNRAKLVNDKLFIKGQYQAQYKEQALPVLSINRPEIIPEISVSNDITDSGSVFRSYSAMATNLHEVKEVIDTLLLRPEVVSATHLMYAYRFHDHSHDHLIENFDSDDDHGLGLEILKAMRTNDALNTVCITTRTCSPDYKHLNQKRFEYVRNTVKEAMDKQ